MKKKKNKVRYGMVMERHPQYTIYFIASFGKEVKEFAKYGLRKIIVVQI